MEEDPTKRSEVHICSKCKNDLKDQPWCSQFEAQEHYKSTTCNSCGKKNWVKMNFMGSGDDDWKPVEEDDE